MQIELGVAELQHVPEDRDGPSLSAHQVGQREQRRLGAGWIRVVAIVDEQRAIGHFHRAHPPPRRGGVREPAQDDLRAEAEGHAYGRRRGGVVAVVRPDQLQLRHEPRAGELQLDAQARAAVVGGDQADVAAESSAEGHQLAPRQPGLREHPGIVRVRNRGGGVAQRMEELTLGVRDALDGAASLEVHGGDVGHQPDVRIGPLREPRDLAEVVHPAFDGGVSVLLRQAQQREWNSNLVVEVAFGLQRGTRGREHLRDQLLRAGLSGGPGNADELEPGQLASPPGGEIAQRTSGVGHGQERGARRLRLHLFDRVGGHQRARSAALHRLGDEVAAVEGRPAQRHEEPALYRRSRIRENTLEGPSGHGDPRSRGPGDLLGREARAQREISSRARRASSRSSNGRFSVPTIW